MGGRAGRRERRVGCEQPDEDLEVIQAAVCEHREGALQGVKGPVRPEEGLGDRDGVVLPHAGRENVTVVDEPADP